MNTWEVFRRIAFRTGKYSLFLAILAVALNYWGVLALDKIPIPHFIDILYAYVLANGSAASLFLFLERKAQLALGAACPQCKGPLEAITSYNCPNCERLEYKKQQ